MILGSSAGVMAVLVALGMVARVVVGGGMGVLARGVGGIDGHGWRREGSCRAWDVIRVGRREKGNWIFGIRMDRFIWSR